MYAHSFNLTQFKLEGVLGEGAELQVFAATEIGTGRAVVVKRPHPALVARSQHYTIEQTLAQVSELRQEPSAPVAYLPRFIGHAPAANYDAYFGDSLGQAYTVIVEERARGLPLVGNIVDGIKGHPIGIPQNLFAVYPVVAHAQAGTFTILHAILNVAEAFYKRGLILLDLRPQNIFFDPRQATITVIDLGDIAVERAATRRQAALDMHDFYLELFKWYVAPGDPHESPAWYARPYGVESAAAFSQQLDRITEHFSAVAREPQKSAAVAILRLVRQRGYRDFDAFSCDFRHYLGLAEEHYRRLAASAVLLAAWQAAKDRLREPYWGKFRFDVEQDLAPYQTP